ncbi:ABC transporter ATP-binding protein [Desulfobacterales bacterium HSG16]|nr:ABC transporter ATP-binding protein [Desulfobacterales bacterium HSG16]
MIEIKNLGFSYNGHTILENVNLEIKNREFMAVIGPNGAGKTTLLKLMIGLFVPDRGKVRIFGEKPSKVAHRIGYVPQEIGINKKFPISVSDVVLMGRLKPGKSLAGYSAYDRKAAREALEQMEMHKYEKRRIGELSGGQRQRVFIARALAVQPDILFLDEPTASVDSKGQTGFYEILKKLNEKITIVVVSHDFMVLSSYIKSVACVSKNVYYHDAAELTEDMADMCSCSAEFISHGIVPHRVLRKHG